ncbi:MAG: DUF488 domain-containing protein [Bacteroidia bacterium]
MSTISIKRIYEEASADDGYRILIDRLWPRGISKEKAKLDEWNKDIAPSTELRKWFDHTEERFEEFVKRYKKELTKNKVDLERLKIITKQKNVSLLYSAKNEKCNQAVVLQQVLKSM